MDSMTHESQSEKKVKALTREQAKLLFEILNRDTSLDGHDIFALMQKLKHIELIRRRK
jgi:hypothetical protein